MKSFTRTALGGAALLATSAAFPVAFTSAAHADPFTASCTGSTTLLSCTFTANSGFFFIDSQAADLNLSGTVTSAREVFSGGSRAGTASGITFNSPQNVDSLGSLNLTADLKPCA